VIKSVTPVPCRDGRGVKHVNSLSVLQRFALTFGSRYALMFILMGIVAYAQVNEMTPAACKEASGVWIKATRGVPGDGTSYVRITATGPAASEVLGGQTFAYRQLRGNENESTCLMNPPQPPTVANSSKRRCTEPCNDMSVESCKVLGSAVTCEYVNSKDAPAKFVTMGVCFKP
jgi:hypothetical protein